MTEIKPIELRHSTKEVAIDLRSDDLEWAERCIHWSGIAFTKPKQSKAKRKPKAPLILTGHGVRLSIDKGTLLVRNGFTHYPQEPEELRFFPGNRKLPSRIVVLDGKGSLSFQVLAWLSLQNIPLVQIDWEGNVVAVAGSTAQAVGLKLVDAQKAARSNGRALKLAQSLVCEKIENAVGTLRGSLPTSPATELAISRLEKDVAFMRKSPPETSDKLRGVEGRVGYQYFKAWQSFPLRWNGLNKHPIPEDWKRIGWRRSYISDSNRHADHPVNAMLNYAYGILENTVRMYLAGLGFDLSVGVLHGSYEDKQPLVYDLMEPLRPIMDRAVLKIVGTNIFTPSDFTLTDRGVCRLNPQLAKAVVADVEIGAEVERLVRRAASALIR